MMCIGIKPLGLNNKEVAGEARVPASHPSPNGYQLKCSYKKKKPFTL